MGPIGCVGRLADLLAQARFVEGLGDGLSPAAAPSLIVADVCRCAAVSAGCHPGAPRAATELQLPLLGHPERAAPTRPCRVQRK